METRSHPLWITKPSTAQPDFVSPSSAKTLVELFTQRCAADPEALAYAFLRDDLTITAQLSYANLAIEVRALARRIAGRTQPGDRVLLVYGPGLEVVRAFWACLHAGTIPVPAPSPDAVRLKRSLPRLLAIATDAQTALILTTAAIRDAASELSLPANLDLASAMASDIDQAAEGELPRIAPGDLAYLQYTSGSTSAPRGAMITHANVLANCKGLTANQEPDATSRSLSWLPYFHDYGLVHGIIWPFYAGMPAYLMSPVTFVRRPLRWLEAIAQFGISHSGAPNFGYAACVQALERS
ncbi:MAG: AMP-binding protein, partial [Gammaproteobacteria bacterium]